MWGRPASVTSGKGFQRDRDGLSSAFGREARRRERPQGDWGSEQAPRPAVLRLKPQWWGLEEGVSLVNVGDVRERKS